jgi:hypothetical protein
MLLLSGVTIGGPSIHDWSGESGNVGAVILLDWSF